MNATTMHVFVCTQKPSVVVFLSWLRQEVQFKKSHIVSHRCHLSVSAGLQRRRAAAGSCKRRSRGFVSLRSRRCVLLHGWQTAWPPVCQDSRRTVRRGHVRLHLHATRRERLSGPGEEGKEAAGGSGWRLSGGGKQWQNEVICLKLFVANPKAFLNKDSLVGPSSCESSHFHKIPHLMAKHQMLRVSH